MRKVIWSPKAIHDYSSIIDYLLSVWTVREVQHFINKVMSAVSALENGDVEFKKLGIKGYHAIVIQKNISIINRIVSINNVQIIRIWDSRQNPHKLK